jgi:hypothetical protein
MKDIAGWLITMSMNKFPWEADRIMNGSVSLSPVYSFAKGNLFFLRNMKVSRKVSSVSFGKFPIGSRFKMNG